MKFANSLAPLENNTKQICRSPKRAADMYVTHRHNFHTAESDKYAHVYNENTQVRSTSCKPGQIVKMERNRGLLIVTADKPENSTRINITRGNEIKWQDVGALD